MRLERNWTQQQLANECNLSLRTIQRIEKDGVASSDSISAYCAVFEIKHEQIILAYEEVKNISAPRATMPVYIWLLLSFLSGCVVTIGLISIF